MNFLDDEGNILIPKAVRPIVDHQTTLLGEKKGSDRQYRCGKLHVREYSSHYSVHMDSIDPRIDALGHLMIDTPHFMTGILSLAKIAKNILRLEQE